jgi:hypothetical protein
LPFCQGKSEASKHNNNPSQKQLQIIEHLTLHNVYGQRLVSGIFILSFFLQIARPHHLFQKEAPPSSAAVSPNAFTASTSAPACVR